MLSRFKSLHSGGLQIKSTQRSLSQESVPSLTLCWDYRNIIRVPNMVRENRSATGLGMTPPVPKTYFIAKKSSDTLWNPNVFRATWRQSELLGRLLPVKSWPIIRHSVAWLDNGMRGAASSQNAPVGAEGKYDCRHLRSSLLALSPLITTFLKLLFNRMSPEWRQYVT